MHQRKNINELKSRYKKSTSLPVKEDNSLRQNHPLIVFTRIATGIKLVLVCLMLFAIIGAIIIYTTDLTWAHPLLQIWLILGAVVGIIWAVYIGKKVDLADVAYRAKSSEDVDEIYNENQKRKNLDLGEGGQL